MFSFVVSKDVRPELAHLRAVILLQAAIVRLLLRLMPDALRHLTDADRRELAELSKPLGWEIAAESTHGLVAAGTLRGWFRRLVTKTPPVAKAPQRTSGRAPISASNQALIVRLARENTWGYRKIVGVMAGLGVVVSRSSVRRILQAHGIKPAPARERARGSWRAFLAAHWSTLASIDLTCVPILTLAGWKTCYVGVVMQVATRRVHLCVVTCHPDQAVMQQIARSLTMADTAHFAHCLKLPYNPIVRD